MIKRCGAGALFDTGDSYGTGRLSGRSEVLLGESRDTEVRTTKAKARRRYWPRSWRRTHGG